MSILILTLCLSHCSTIDTADVGLAIIQEYMASDKMKITNLEQENRKKFLKLRARKQERGSRSWKKTT